MAKRREADGSEGEDRGISTPAAAQACSTVVPGGTCSARLSTKTSIAAGCDGGTGSVPAARCAHAAHTGFKLSPFSGSACSAQYGFCCLNILSKLMLEDMLSISTRPDWVGLNFNLITAFWAEHEKTKLTSSSGVIKMQENFNFLPTFLLIITLRLVKKHLI